MLWQIPNQSILSDYVYKVEEKTAKDTELYAIRLKKITEVSTYQQVWISEVDKENILHVILYTTTYGDISRAWESDRKCN